VILALFILTSSGFTAVVHTCVMGSAESCACEPEPEKKPVSGHVITDGLGCCTTHLAGGLIPVPTTLGVSESHGKAATTVSLDFPADVSPELTGAHPSFLLLSDLPRGVPPCASEKYLLNATFRI
jgi:hypothetical protein